MKLLIRFLITVFSFMATLNAQTFLKKAPYKIVKNNLDSQGFKLVHYSKKKYALLKKQNGDITEYYLGNIENSADPNKIGDKEKLFSFNKEDNVRYIYFSRSGGQIIFRTGEKKGKKEWKLYDIKTKRTKIIKNSEGTVISVSAYDFNNILYYINLKNERPKIYLIKDNQKPIFIANGFGCIWSNNRNYFLCETYQNNSLSLREKLEFGLITNDEYRNLIDAQKGTKREIFSRYVIYNSNGEKLLVLKDFDLVNWIKWSPDNKKIVLQESNDVGFKIIYLNYLTETNIKIANVYHFPGIKDIEKGKYTTCEYPKWSPDGEKILFITEVDGEWSELYNNAYILEDSTKICYPLINSNDVYISIAEWTSNKSVIFAVRSINDNSKNIYELIFEKE